MRETKHSLIMEQQSKWLKFSPHMSSVKFTEMRCLKAFLSTLGFTLGEIVGHAIIFEPSLFWLSSHTASLWLLNANDLEACPDDVHTP
jgi:hypothetical protein